MRSARRGAATVELALILPFLIYTFVAVVDFSRIFYHSLTVSNCARNGATYACDLNLADKLPYDTIEQAALADAVSLSQTATVTSTNGVDGSGNAYVEVTVVYPFKTVTNYPGIPSTVNISRTVRMRSTPSIANE